MEHSQNVMDVLTQSGAIIGGHPGIEDAIIKERDLNCETITVAELAAVVTDSNSHAKAIAFLLGCNRTRYGKLIEDLLKKDFLQGRNNYPKPLCPPTIS
jgi:hypothetical protein